ncbi:hypothetical protein [Azospirillum sp. BE72]|uniref:hypothetical protein n=1 Tax=Azospirillum sp. BE72 TaxID=2817776 RepID=UPI002864C41B|nr:hypothetical protein [Azospirillum sp. BE72]MDR6769351.1 hypothetical protein [Azospirillum sp. BE72]
MSGYNLRTERHEERGAAVKFSRAAMAWVEAVADLEPSAIANHSMTAGFFGFGVDRTLILDLIDKVASEDKENVALRALVVYTDIYRALGTWLGYEFTGGVVPNDLRSLVAALAQETGHDIRRIFHRLDHEANPEKRLGKAGFDDASWKADIRNIRQKEAEWRAARSGSGVGRGGSVPA